MSCLQVGQSAQWRPWTSVRCSPRLGERQPALVSENARLRCEWHRARPDPQGHSLQHGYQNANRSQDPGTGQSRGQWPQEKRERKAPGAALRGLLPCGRRHRSTASRGRSGDTGPQKGRQADPPSSPRPPGSLGGPRSASLAPAQRRADTQPPSPHPRFSPLPLTRALLVSNLVSILQASGSEVPTQAPPLPAALRLPPRQRRGAAPPGSSPTNFRSQEPRPPGPQRRHRCWPREPTAGREGRGSFRSAVRQDGHGWGRLCGRPEESESSSPCVFLRPAGR